MLYFFDTNSIIYFLQGYTELDTIFENIKHGKTTPLLSLITKIELLSFPDLTAKEEMQIRKLLNNFEIVSLNDEIVEETIKIRKQFHLKTPDAIIAASCIINKGILVTRDQKGFGKVKNLKFLNPFTK
ncbi:MAG: type II toxin-antitoxin system VapC family toxin [bacterium]|nr:type II toxin-antitoxin system VapC family toxin [bacterium]